LRTLEHFDALEVRGVNIEIAPRELAGLIVEINGDVREDADRAARLTAGRSARAQPAHVYDALTGPVRLQRHIGEIFDQIIERLNIELGQCFARERLNCDWDILNIF